jgi:hypothetical protein
MDEILTELHLTMHFPGCDALVSLNNQGKLAQLVTK